MKFWILFGICGFVGLVGIVTVSLVYDLTGNEIPIEYGITVDAGSSHTKFALHQWNGNTVQGWNNTRITTQIAQCETGAISYMDPLLLETALHPCLLNVTSQMPTTEIATTPVFLGATAGMRLLNRSEPYLAEAIIIAATCLLTKSGLAVKNVGIISGEEEALFGWITTNFLYSTLQSLKSSPSFGALDLGGASTQASFEIEDEPSTYDLRLYGRDHHVKAKSYLCYGVDEIFRRYSALMVKDLNSTNVIYDPCTPKGYEREMKAEELFDEPCTTTELYREWKCNHNIKSIVFTFNGTGEPTECSKLVSPLLEPDECKQNFTDCFTPLKVPTTITPKFAAFSSFFYTTSFINATNVTLQEYNKNTNYLCGLTWEEVQALPRKGMKNSTLPKVCFQAMYIERLLTVGYGFNETTWTKLMFIESVTGTEVGWSLGYMINATNSIPAEAPYPPAINRPSTIVLLVIFSLVLICSGFFLWKALKERQNNGFYVPV